MKFQISATLIAGPSGEYTLGLEELLGSGNFGFVFKAVDMTNGTHYAVKFTQSGFNNEDEIMAFRNEVQAAQEIQHINVVRIVHVELNPPEQPPYLVMEFINGGTLQSRLDDLSQAGSMLEIPLLQKWTNALIDGIAAINAKMLHRDLKPDNILMDGEIPKIGDFGLSKMIGAMTRSRTFKGGQHLWYMAPEGWKYETNSIQIDMYAMGIVLYQMASLQYPYELPQNFSERAFREMHLYQQPRPLQALRSDIPLKYCHIISRLLEKNPQERFLNWSEVQQAMKKVWVSHEDGEVSPRETILALLQKSEQRGQEYTQQQTEEEKRKEEQEERLRLDVVQQHKLSILIKGLIAEYNEFCSPKMKIGGVGIYDSMRLQLPFGKTVSLDFFQIDPPLVLEIGQVRLAAALKDQDQSRLNYILCRRDANDLYGTWKVCQVDIGLIVGEVSRKHELIGLSDAITMRVMEKADAKYVHIGDNVEDAFLQVITDAISQ